MPPGVLLKMDVETRDTHKIRADGTGILFAKLV